MPLGVAAQPTGATSNAHATNAATHTGFAAPGAPLLAARMRRARLPATLLVPLVPLALAGAAAPVPWTAAADHVRRLVTIEGVVARATTTADRHCVLEFNPDDPAALRVVLIIPLITDLPVDPARLYQGKRVRVTGRVTRFQGRLEMAITPPQIEVVGLTTPPATPAAVVPPTAPPPPAVPPAAPVAPAPAAPAPPVSPVILPTPAAPAAPARDTGPAVPAASSTLPPPVPAPDPRCRGWRDERTAVRSELHGLTRRLDECLAADRGGCAALGDQLGPPLSRLEAVEAQLGRYCP